MRAKENPKKERQSKYEKKLKVNATFDEIVKGMLSKPPDKKKTEQKKDNKKQ